jgi:hypothetical protein
MWYTTGAVGLRFMETLYLSVFHMNMRIKKNKFNNKKKDEITKKNIAKENSKKLNSLGHQSLCLGVLPRSAVHL